MIRLVALHDRLFAAIERAAEPWLLGLLARLLFAGVLFGYYWNSALTKIGEGLGGVFAIQDGAYWQMFGEATLAEYGYDASQLPLLPYDLMAVAGTYAEFLLPILIVLGLATRLAALGMAVFVLVQSWVDVTVHGLDAASIGALFDRLPNAAIWDQRSLWLFPLLYLVVKGAGLVSLDGLLRRRAALDAASAAALDEPGPLRGGGRP